MILFVGLFGIWGGFSAPSLYLAMNTGIFSFIASLPLSVFLVANNLFWTGLGGSGAEVKKQNGQSQNTHVNKLELSGKLTPPILHRPRRHRFVEDRLQQEEAQASRKEPAKRGQFF